ncbi:unnamed protein product [Linum trigynum]|uniref:Uncharacterized protein n=1 Tax=Linum trigynum TaxID=586398 RepID=A0AAV2ESR0_9ROSI
MDSLLSKFFWSVSMQKSNLHWCRKKILCTPKSEGGFGFRSFRDFNLALLAKQARRLINNTDALWSRLIKGLYIPRGNFLSAKEGSKPSWIWASLWESKKVIVLGAIKVIGSGDDTWIDQDPWVPSLPRANIQSGPQNHARVSTWIDLESRKWNDELIQDQVSPPERDAILRVPIEEEDAKDFWAWRFNEDGEFTVKTAYHPVHLSATDPQTMDNVQKWKWM